ncbi:hypothetical protein Tco_1295869 [Tanacetum coccineum]
MLMVLSKHILYNADEKLARKNEVKRQEASKAYQSARDSGRNYFSRRYESEVIKKSPIRMEDSYDQI